MKKLPPQPVVPHVDLLRYMGRWYVIANIPTWPEKGAHNATETYTWNVAKERIDVDYRHNKNAFDGPEKSIPQKAFVHDKESQAEWRVQPFWPLLFSYLIVDLAPDYSDCIVGVPNREHVWIMARQPSLPDARYRELVAKVRALGYDVSKIVKVPQQEKAKRRAS